LGPELEVFSHWACWGFPVGPWYFGGPDCFMHSVRRKPLSLYKNYTHYTLQVERFFFQRIEISMIMELRILFFRLVSVPKGREVWALGWLWASSCFVMYFVMTNPPSAGTHHGWASRALKKVSGIKAK